MVTDDTKSRVIYTPQDRRIEGTATSVIRSNLISYSKDMRATSNLDQSRSFAPAETALLPKICYYLRPVNDTDVIIVPSRRTNMSLLAYAVSKFYPTKALDDIPNEDFLTGLASIVLACANFNVNPQWDELKAAMRTATVQIEFAPITPRELMGLQATDEGIKELQKIFSIGTYVKLIEHSEAFLVIACIILLTLGKNIDPRYYDKWVMNRVRGFCGALGQQTIAGKLTIECLPRSDVMTRISNVICSASSVRRELFIGIATLARSYTKNSYGSAFNEVMQLLKGTEMGHLSTIESYIYNRIPEIANTRLLPSLNANYKRALDYLRSVPQSERMYVKLLRDKNETAPLSRVHFTEATIVASTVAAFDKDSYQYYAVEEGPNVSKLKAIALTYVTNLQRATGVHAMEVSGTPKITGQLLLDKLIGQ